MLNRIDNNIPNTTTVNNRSPIKRTATEAGFIEQPQKTKYFHSEDNVKVNEQDECFLAAVKVLNEENSSVDLYNIINGEKQEIRPYLWLLVFQLKTGAILPHHYNSFNDFLNSYVPRNTTTRTLSLDNSNAVHPNYLSQQQIITEVEFDSLKLSFFDLLINSMEYPNDILLRLINSQDLLLNHYGKFLSVCSFLKFSPNATFEEFNARLDKRKLIIKQVNETNYSFYKNKEGVFNLKLTKKRNKQKTQDSVVKQNEIFVQPMAKYNETYFYSKNIKIDHEQLPTKLSNLAQLDSGLLQAMLDKTDITLEQFNCYKQIFGKIKTNLDTFYTYKVSVNIGVGKKAQEMMVSIRDIYRGEEGGTFSGGVAAKCALSDLYKNKINDPMYKYSRYAMLCAIGRQKFFPRVIFEKLFSLAFANNKSKSEIEAEDKRDIEKVLLGHCPKYEILTELIFAMCLKNPENYQLKNMKNPFASSLKNNEIRLKFQVAAVSWLDSLKPCYSSRTILYALCKHIFFAEPELLAEGAMPVIKACKNLFMRNFKKNDASQFDNSQIEGFEDKKELFWSAFTAISTPNDFRNGIISEVAGFAENLVRQLFLNYRAYPGLFHEMKINRNLVQLITQSFNCSQEIKGDKAFVPGREPEYDETLYYLLEDRIINISDIALTPQMFIIISSPNKNGGLELLTSTAISYFSKYHEAEFKKILINDLDKIIKFNPNTSLERKIIDLLKPKFNSIEQVLPRLIPSPNGYLIPLIRRIFLKKLSTVKIKIEASYDQTLNKILNLNQHLRLSVNHDQTKNAMINHFLTFAMRTCCIRVNDNLFDHYIRVVNTRTGAEGGKKIARAFFVCAWNTVLLPEIIIPALDVIIKTSEYSPFHRQNIELYHNFEYHDVTEEMKSFCNQLLELYAPKSIQELNEESFKEICNKIISLDKSFKETTPELFVQYVLNTICFRTAINLRSILKGLNDSGIVSKGVDILSQIDNYLYTLLSCDDDDRCSIILLTPPDNEEIYFIQLNPEPEVFSLENGKFMINYNIMNSTIVRKIFNPDDDIPSQLKPQIVPEKMFQIKLNNKGQTIRPETTITTAILKEVSPYPHISNYFSKNLGGKTNRSVIGLILAEDSIDVITSLPGCNLEPNDIAQLKKLIYAMTFNLGESLIISLENKNEMFRKCNDKDFASQYALLSLNYFTDYAETHKIENKISVIKAHGIKNLQSSIEHIKSKLLPEIIKLIPHLNQSKLIEKISTACNILNNSGGMIHLFHFSISLTYLYLSSTYGLGKYQGGNASFSIFRMLGTYHLAVSLLNMAEKEGIYAFATQKKDLASTIIFEIMDALDDSCSALIANRLFKEGNGNHELKKLQSLTQQMLTANVNSSITTA